MNTSSVHQNFILHRESGDASRVVIPRREIYRYLGYRKITPSEDIAARTESCVKEMTAKSHLSAVWIVLPLERPESGVLRIGDIVIRSRSLSLNLKGCDAAAMMAATIGPGIDFLIRRSEAVSMLDAAVYQAAGAAFVEAWCDEVNTRIVQFMQERGHFSRPRFSPGYGDLPLSLQKDFSRILNMSKNCGISLTDTLLMTPSKSVTAFIGFYPGPEDRCAPAGCGSCTSRNSCDYHQ